MSSWKKTISSWPVVGPSLKRLRASVTPKSNLVFRNSEQYWEDRYREGGNSGAGSYGRLARFKADFLNEYVHNKGVSAVVEFGCGDGAQLALAEYPRYTGFDVSPTVIELCRARFADNRNYEFDLVGSEAFEGFEAVDLALSLDVIYHLIEDHVFESYMQKLFASANKSVIIYAYDFDKEYVAKHEKGRRFTSWINRRATDWRLVQVVDNRFPYDPADPEGSSQSSFFVYERRI